MRIRLLILALLLIGVAGCGPDFDIKFPTDYEFEPDYPANYFGTWNLMTIQQDGKVVAPSDSIYAFWFPRTVLMMKLEDEGVGQVRVEESGIELGIYPCIWRCFASLCINYGRNGDCQRYSWTGLASVVGDTLRMYQYTSRYGDSNDNTSYRHDWTYVREWG